MLSARNQGLALTQELFHGMPKGEYATLNLLITSVALKDHRIGVLFN